MEIAVKVSAEKKKAVLTRYYLLAQLCQQYTADRHALAGLCRLIKAEFKHLKKTVAYPLTDADARDINYFIAELKDISVGLRKARHIERHTVLAAHLAALLDKMREVLAATDELLGEKKPQVTLDSAIETAKTIRDFVERGVSGIKKTFGGES